MGKHRLHLAQRRRKAGWRTRRSTREWLRAGRISFAFGLAWLGIASASPAALQFDVFLGYEGVAREASWMPIVCEVKNEGPSFNAVIEVAPGQFGKGQTHALPVELPTGTLKRVVIPVFSPTRYPSPWNVRLLDERGKVREERAAERPRRLVGWEVPLIGSLARTVSGVAGLPAVKREPSDAQPASVRLQPVIFPDNPLVLEGLDAIYLSSEVATGLRASQANALLAWMHAGGHLIVGVEQVSDITALPWLRAVLPCEPREFKTIGAHPELQAWLQTPGTSWEWSPRSTPRPGGRRASSSTRSGVSPDNPFADQPVDAAFEQAELQVAFGPVRGGRVLAAAGGTPLLVAASRGAGRVTALMFSPEREPFKSWKNLPAFWAKLAEVPGHLFVSTDHYGVYGQSTDGIFGAMIDSRQIHKLPIGWLLVLLLVYLLIIGPLDQWWLRRINRPMLTWITFPCYVGLFSLLIYFIGYKLRAGETEYNELHLVDVLRHGDRAELRGRTYASIYSPSNQKFPLEGRQKYAALRGEFFGSAGDFGSERNVVVQRGDNFTAEVFVPVWTSQLYVSDWWQGEDLPLSVTVTPQGDAWGVTVENHTGQPVRSLQLAVDGVIIPLGEVGAGRTAAFTAQRSAGVNLPDFVQQHGKVFNTVVQQRRQAFGASTGGRIDDLPNASIAASFIAQLRRDQSGMSFVVPPGLDLSRVVERGNAVLLAWSPDAAPVPALGQFKAKRMAQHTLWRVPVTVEQ